MGIPVLIMGESGSGKSASMRNLDPEKVGVFNVAGKPMPFRRRLKTVNNATYADIYKMLAKPKLKTYIIDDSQYLMSFEEMDSTKTGFDKFNSIGFNFVGLVRFVRSQLPKDTIVYFLHHPEYDDNGRLKPKTIGKLIDNHFTLEGLFEIAITSDYEKGEYIFRTRTDGMTPFKNPPDMLPDVMPNDLKQADSAIRDYWSMLPLVDEGGDSQ
jgi:hypothetical protein